MFYASQWKKQYKQTNKQKRYKRCHWGGTLSQVTNLYSLGANIHLRGKKRYKGLKLYHHSDSFFWECGWLEDWQVVIHSLVWGCRDKSVQKNIGSIPCISFPKVAIRNGFGPEFTVAHWSLHLKWTIILGVVFCTDFSDLEFVIYHNCYSGNRGTVLFIYLVSA